MADEKIFFDFPTEFEAFERRFSVALEIAAPRRGTLAWLEQKTGLSQSKWKNMLAKKQRPTSEMVLAICHLRPDLARWLILGRVGEPDRMPSQSEINLAQEVIQSRGSRHIAKPTEKFSVWTDTLPATSSPASGGADKLDQPNPIW
jgi:hypothetical protein